MYYLRRDMCPDVISCLIEKCRACKFSIIDQFISSLGSKNTSPSRLVLGYLVPLGPKMKLTCKKKWSKCIYKPIKIRIWWLQLSLFPSHWFFFRFQWIRTQCSNFEVFPYITRQSISSNLVSSSCSTINGHKKRWKQTCRWQMCSSWLPRFFITFLLVTFFLMMLISSYNSTSRFFYTLFDFILFEIIRTTSLPSQFPLIQTIWIRPILSWTELILQQFFENFRTKS